MHDFSDCEEEEQTFFPTKGKFIVNAATGIQTIFRVGSKNELKFWKVLDVSLKSYDPSTGTGETYFFPSPETYENGRNVKISNDRKRAWKKRQKGDKCACLSAHVCTSFTTKKKGLELNI